MFFVGATGQLLTLILTVSLPLVFLVSGHQKIDVQQNKLNFEIQQNYLKISSFENDTFDYFLNYFTEYQCTVFNIEDSDFKKIPPEKIKVKWKSFCLNDSGNKAPPISIC
ncbi:MAG: hypothetical protein HN778_12600 [Prolixibacteraceae bacterium]|jgi:hypothetical protein|nr:hypothetical protein [Prolixibacteraceae bacterium]MBT6007485.1 hypothetical protein [Prolixibacteraceae bacterium]MBT6764095.1 hypothetical protein [Prolixibacteraceae bacterium]MBT6997307.1 hypothetical protein [Prolixibacteraceae bacterium]MBT7395666.1 hypothetical protein [Prolixibacteraceae bacterium]